MADPSIRLLVIVNVYKPDLGGGVLFADLCEGLAEKGFQVTVKCAYSYYPEWTDKNGENGWRIRSTIDNHVTVERHGLFIPWNPNSLFQRLLYEASFYLSLRRRRPRRGSFDAVLVICPLVGSVAYAASVCRKTHAPLWLNVQDLSAQAAAAGGIAGSARFTRLLLYVQNYLFAKADVWSSISEPMVDVLSGIRRASRPIELVPNWLHESLAIQIRAHCKPPHRPGSDTVRLLYSGNIGTKQDLLGFCQYLHATDLNFHLRIQGDGGRAPDLTAWLNDVQDDRFEFRALSDEEELARALADADYYVITERTGVGSSFIPSKLIPGITSGTPILAVCDPGSPLGQEMVRYHLGPRIDWLNLDYAKSVIDIRNVRSDDFKTWKTNAEQRSTYFSREEGISRSESLIRSMLTKHSAR